MTNKPQTTTGRWGNSEEWWRWSALLKKEHDLHGRPFGDDFNPEDYREFWENEKSPHTAIEEAFNDGGI